MLDRTDVIDDPIVRALLDALREAEITPLTWDMTTDINTGKPPAG